MDEQKVPETFGEKVKDYLKDVKLYRHSKRVLRWNKFVKVCTKCGRVYPNSHDSECDKCGGYMFSHSSKTVEVSIPSRKEKYRHIEEYNQEIKNANERRNRYEKFQKAKKYSEMVNDLFGIHSNELLNYFILLQKADEYYDAQDEETKKELDKTRKDNVIREIIENKFNTIWVQENKIELCKSFIEELKYCSKRFPNYTKLLNIEIIKVENSLEDAINNNSKKEDITDNDDIDKMDGIEFERFIVKLLKKLGYENVKQTPISGDFGIDVLAEKENIKYAIQCKNYSSALDNKCVQEAYSGKQYYNSHVGIVVTNNYFTKHAKELANKNGIILWDRDKLLELISDAK